VARNSKGSSTISGFSLSNQDLQISSIKNSAISSRSSMAMKYQARQVAEVEFLQISD